MLSVSENMSRLSSETALSSSKIKQKNLLKTSQLITDNVHVYKYCFHHQFLMFDVTVMLINTQK